MAKELLFFSEHSTIVEYFISRLGEFSFDLIKPGGRNSF